MDDVVSTIVYLILTLVIVLGGLLSRKKKTRTPMQSQQDNEPAYKGRPSGPKLASDTSPIDQFFSSFIDEQTMEESYPEEPIEVEIPTFEEKKVVEKLDSIPKEEGLSAFSYDDPATRLVEIQPIEDLIKEEENLSTEDLTNPYISEDKVDDEAWKFDIRQAIIYSEILKPKF